MRIGAVFGTLGFDSYLNTDCFQWQPKIVKHEDSVILAIEGFSVSSQNGLTWNIRQIVNKSASTLWNVRLRVTKNNSVIWNVRQRGPWNNLSDESKEIYMVFERDLRALSGELQRVLNKISLLNTNFSLVQSILVDLDDNTLVPNLSGMPGSSSLLSDAEMVTLVSYLTDLLPSYDGQSQRNLRIKAAGLVNTGL